MTDRFARQIILLLTMLGMATVLMLLAHAATRAEQFAVSADALGLQVGVGVGCDPVCPQPDSRLVFPVLPTPQYSPLPGRCRVFAADGSTGSGTLISADGVVVTCEHIFRDSQQGIAAVFPDGRRFAGTLIYRDAANDLAAFRIASNTGIVPVVVDHDDGLTGQVTAGGFGGDGAFRAVRGFVISHARPQGADEPSAVMAGSVRPGDSGGGVVNADRQLVGVVWGCESNQTYFACGAPLERLMEKIWPTMTPIAPTPVAPPIVAPMPPIVIVAPPTPAALPLAPTPAPHSATPPTDATPIDRAVSAAASATETALSVRSLGKWVVGGSAILGPIGAVAGLGAWIAVRRIKKKVGEKLSEIGGGASRGNARAEQPTRRIAIDAPPLPQYVGTEQHYVPYEIDSFAKAHSWASEQLVRKYPGTTEALSTLDSLIKQFLSAKKN